jgi:hypothetical protein
MAGDNVKEALVTVHDVEHSERISKMREQLMRDMSAGDLIQLQLKVDTLVKLAALAGEHHHDSTGGVGHHDHSSLADLSWRLERPMAIDQVAEIKGRK